MFVLTTISDVIQIAPQDFEPRKKSIHAVEDNIHKKYANKVIQQIGLCICFWDLLKASEGLISQGDGMVNVNVVFRLVVFRPFKGEIIQGTITEASLLGIRVSVDIFDDIFVPGTRLMHPSEFSVKDETWIWEYDDQPFYYEVGEQVRLRVEAEVWHDKTPGRERIDNEAKSTGENVATAATTTATTTTMTSTTDNKVPYTIIGSMADPCLGCLLWWEGEETAAATATAAAVATDQTNGTMVTDAGMTDAQQDATTT